MCRSPPSELPLTYLNALIGCPAMFVLVSSIPFSLLILLALP